MHYTIYNFIKEIRNAGLLAKLSHLSPAERNLIEAGVRTGNSWGAARYVWASRYGDGDEQFHILSRAWEEVQMKYRAIAADGVSGSGVEEAQEWDAALRMFNSSKQGE